MSKSLKTKDFFYEIWCEREHVSEVSGEYLGEEPLSYFFSHVCSKGAYTDLRWNKRNIMLMTWAEHRIWEFHDPVSPSGEVWEKVFQRQEEMQQLSAKHYKI